MYVNIRGKYVLKFRPTSALGLCFVMLGFHLQITKHGRPATPDPAPRNRKTLGLIGLILSPWRNRSCLTVWTDTSFSKQQRFRGLQRTRKQFWETVVRSIPGNKNPSRLGSIAFFLVAAPCQTHPNRAWKGTQGGCRSWGLSLKTMGFSSLWRSNTSKNQWVLRKSDSLPGIFRVILQRYPFRNVLPQRHAVRSSARCID